MSVTAVPLPFVRADWFVFAASRPPLYHDVLGLPEIRSELEKRLEIDVEAGTSATTAWPVRDSTARASRRTTG